VTNEKLIEKIRKLMRKTVENGATESEAETSLLIAQQLMAKHGLSEAHVQETSITEKDTQIVRDTVDEIKRFTWWELLLSNVIADNFRCYTYRTIHNRNVRIVFFGKQADTEICKELFDIYRTIIVNLYKNYVASYPQQVRSKIRNSYVKGFLHGLMHKLKEQVANNTEMSLVLVKDTAVVQAYEAMNVKKTSLSVNESANPTHYQQGYYDSQTHNKSLK
jgi:hypothetical protein